MRTTGHFTASDGVRIGYRRGGSGPPLMLVHGACTDHRCFDPIHDTLAERFTVTAYDRRGRGLSGTATDYSLDREALDVVEAARQAGDGAPVAVVGYSYGATAALRAVTTRPAPVTALVAYEAPFPVPDMIPARDEVFALLTAGRPDEALRLFVRTTFHLSERAVTAMMNHPMWTVSLESVAGLQWEDAGIRSATLEPTVPVPPVRYLVAAEGGNPAFRTVAELVRTTIPGATVATVPGLPHFAIPTEPAAFVSAVLDHLEMVSTVD
jgi:pimeloyl-ACP methyl ester carboxylesterase